MMAHTVFGHRERGITRGAFGRPPQCGVPCPTTGGRATRQPRSWRAVAVDAMGDESNIRRPLRCQNSLQFGALGWSLKRAAIHCIGGSPSTSIGGPVAMIRNSVDRDAQHPSLQ